AVTDAHELRRGATDSPVDGLVDHVRPGYRESEPAGLHRHVPGRLPDSGNTELAVGVSARRVPGQLRRYAAHRSRTADPEHPQQLRLGSHAARTARSAVRA